MPRTAQNELVIASIALWEPEARVNSITGSVPPTTHSELRRTGCPCRMPIYTRRVILYLVNDIRIILCAEE